MIFQCVRYVYIRFEVSFNFFIDLNESCVLIDIYTLSMFCEKFM